MGSKAKQLLNDALQLPPTEREALAGELFDSLEKDDPAAEAEWRVEIEKRVNEMDQGKVRPIPWAQARKMIFGDTDDPGRD
jgi:putative addiction module component (TIGR02574 family)